MNKAFRCLCTSLFLLAGSSACTETTFDYFPLAKGYDWYYQIRLNTTNGSENQKYIVSTLAPRTINDEITYIHRSLTGTQILFRQSDAGISRIGYLVRDGQVLNNVEDEELLLPAKLEVGAEWESIVLTQTLTKGKPGTVGNLQVQAKVPVSNRIESMDDKVEVPAGVFSQCVRLHTKGFTFYKGSSPIGRAMVEVDETKWYAPGVGLVKSVLLETTTSDALSKGELIMELESFRGS